MYQAITTVMQNEVQRIKRCMHFRADPEEIYRIGTGLFLVNRTQVIQLTKHGDYSMDLFDLPNTVRGEILEFYINQAI